MKKRYFCLFILTLLLLPTKVFASDMSISISCGSGNVGDSITCVVRGTPDAGVSSASGSISISGTSAEYVSTSLGSLSNGNANSNSFNLYGSTQNGTFNLFTITFRAKSAGTTTVSVTLRDISDGNFEDFTINKTASSSINVTEPTPPPQPEPVQPTQPSTNTSQPAKQETKKETTKEVKKEEIKEEKKEETKKEEVTEEKKLDITKFDIVGYDIAFVADKYEYSINVDKNVNSLYIIIEGKDLEIEGDKEVIIKGKDKIVIKVKENDITKEYTINLVRNNKQNEKTNTSSKNNSNQINNILIGTTTCFAITTLGSIGYIIYQNKKGKDIKNETKKR